MHYSIDQLQVARNNLPGELSDLSEVAEEMDSAFQALVDGTVSHQQMRAIKTVLFYYGYPKESFKEWDELIDWIDSQIKKKRKELKPEI